jgi:hypothetical protein
MAFSQTQLTAIEDAIASGTTRVSYDGKSVEYASLDVMLRVRNIIQIALGIVSGTSATVLVAHDRGYPPGYGNDDV